MASARLVHQMGGVTSGLNVNARKQGSSCTRRRSAWQDGSWMGEYEDETLVRGVYMKRQQQFPQPASPEAAAPPDTPTHFVYLLACADQTLYTGYTTNVERRLAAHNAGSGARYTRGRRPVILLAAWALASKGEALRAERAIKGLSRQQKWHLVLAGGLDGGTQNNTSASSTHSWQTLTETGAKHS